MTDRDTTAPADTVLLVGASRGLGLALAAAYLDRGAQVVATVRGDDHPELRRLAEQGDGALTIEHVDIDRPDEVEALRDRLGGARFTVLHVNAGVTHREDLTVADIDTDEFIRVMVTNALSPLRLIERLDGVVDPHGTIAVMSSGQGSIANNERGGFEVYRASKSALNQLMRSYAARHRDDPRTLLLLAPGWVRTALGGPGARLTPQESAVDVVETVLAQRGHGGLQFLDRHAGTVAW
ncbi:MAG: SDR family oxidoreductase [Nocardioidaceae bacterium]|nr:SDR family oxidoreductase [Nocardioidaceae bacterium]